MARFVSASPMRPPTVPKDILFTAFLPIFLFSASFSPLSPRSHRRFFGENLINWRCYLLHYFPKKNLMIPRLRRIYCSNWRFREPQPPREIQIPNRWLRFSKPTRKPKDCLLWALAFAALFLFCRSGARAQVEHVPVAHPVYAFLMHLEARGGALRNFSSSALPLQRKEIVAALESLRRGDSLLAESERSTLAGFEREFRIVSAPRAVLFHTPSDSAQILFERLVSNDEKFLSFYTSPEVTVSVTPLLSAEARAGFAGASLPSSSSAVLGAYGGRIFGTIDSALGFFLQGTSSAVFQGEREFLLQDPFFFQNPVLKIYNPNFINFSESHIRYDNRWFYAGAGRETRLVGSGYLTRGIMSNNALAADAFMLGARFPANNPDSESGFEYRFMHFSLLAEPIDLKGNINPRTAGAEAIVPSKFMAYHRASLRGAWGEASVWESVIYSNRGLELAYAVPFSFLKGTSDNLRDRDNAALGVDATLRPLSGIQIKGTFLLDDIDFGRLGADEEGRHWWQNKIAWNLGVMLSPRAIPFDATLEYSMVTPYTYTHFERQNAMTQDGILFAGNLPPNADELTAQVRWFWGGRYPLALTASYRRHGRNTFDADGKLVDNFGGDVLQTVRRDSLFALTDRATVVFLEGDREDRLTLTLSGGVEIIRHINAQFLYRFTAYTALAASSAPLPRHFVGISLRFEDF